MTSGDGLLNRLIAAHLSIDLAATGQRRTLTAADPDALLDYVLDAIAQTLLPRRLSFTAADGTALCVDVANGGVLGPAPRPRWSDNGQALQQDEPTEDPEIMADLMNLTANRTSLTLSWDRLDRTTSTSDTAFMPRMANAPTQDEGAPVSPDIPPIFDFIDHLDLPPTSLMIVNDGQITHIQGVAIPAYLAHSTAIWDKASLPIPGSQSDQKTRIIILSSADQTILFARSEHHDLIALYDGDQAHLFCNRICKPAPGVP